MYSLLKFLLGAVFFLALSLLTLWGALAIWFRLPTSELMRSVVIVMFVIVAFAAIIAFLIRRKKRALVVYAIINTVLFSWWGTLDPPSDADWAPDVARQVTGEIEGDMLSLSNVREFQWHSKDEFTENWTQRTYDLSKLQSVDYFLSHWGNPNIAHFILSFGFSDGEYLAWSVEVRRQEGGQFSPVGDFFKSNALVIIAAVEEDVVGVRSKFRGEDVHLFRARAKDANLRALIEQYVEDANKLAEKPAWYNSLTTNCTTVVFKMIMAHGNKRPFDWRLIANGNLPEYSLQRGSLNTEYSAQELRQLGLITERAKNAGLGPGFSEAIRVGVPVPQ